MTTHAELLTRWRQEGGEAFAQEQLDKRRAYQREQSKKFYAKHAGRVMGWVLRYQAERRPESVVTRTEANKEALRLTQQERAAGRPRPLFCEVCDQPDQRGRRLHYDHCHARGHFRGWLCGNCNAALGFAADNPEVLMRLAVYLQMDRDKNWPKE